MSLGPQPFRPPNGRGGYEKPPKNAEHSPLSVQGVKATFIGTVHFRVLVHRDFQVTVMTVNNTKNIREGLILLFKYILVDGHGGHLQSPMYGNVPCAPDATRPPAIQRPATQQPANRRPAMQRPTTSNSQPRVPRPEGGRRPGSKSPEAGDHGARVQEGAKRQESRRLEVQRQRAESVFGQATEVLGQLLQIFKNSYLLCGMHAIFLPNPFRDHRESSLEALRDLSTLCESRASQWLRPEQAMTMEIPPGT